MIYTWVSKESKIDNAYELKLNIPRVNISNTAVERFNEKIKELYVNKANDIIRSKSNAIYTVEYIELYKYKHFIISNKINIERRK